MFLTAKLGLALNSPLYLIQRSLALDMYLSTLHFGVQVLRVLNAGLPNPIPGDTLSCNFFNLDPKNGNLIQQIEFSLSC